MESVSVSLELEGGSSVTEIVQGGNYLMTDRPGTYTVKQFDSCDAVIVREAGRGTILTVLASSLQRIGGVENYRNRDLTLIEGERIDRAERLLEDIRPLLAYRRIPKAVLDAQAVATGRAAKTLRKWAIRYRKDPRLSTLHRKQRSDVGDSRFDDVLEKEIRKAVQILMQNGGLRVVDAHEELEIAVLALRKSMNDPDIPVPSYGTLYNRFKEISERDKAEAKLGKRQAKLLNAVEKGSIKDLSHPLGMVQVDHLELQVEVVDEESRMAIGRAWMTVLIDVFSRCLCGYYVTLEAPGNLSLGLAMAHAILPKDETLKTLSYGATWPVHGLMTILHADNAGEFHGNMLEVAAAEYSIELMYRKVRHPNYGGFIESYLGTLSDDLRRVPGATREGPHALGDTDPSKLAAMTLAELEQYVLHLIVEYHNHPHSGIQRVTPLQRFAQGLRGEAGAMPIGHLRRIDSPAKLRHDFLPCDERCVHPKGVLWDHIWYVDDVLQRWVNARDLKDYSEKRRFLVRRDPRDLSRIYFGDPEESRYRVIGTRNLARPAITLWELRRLAKIVAASGDPINEDTLFAARSERRRVEEDASARTRLAQRKRSREKERGKRAKKGAEDHREAVGAAVIPVSTPPKAEPRRGTAFTFDWDA